jgi:hypothetical protein
MKKKLPIQEAAAQNDAKIERIVAELNKLIASAIDSDGDAIGVIDRSGTWEEPYTYEPIQYKNGRLFITSKSLYSTQADTEVITRANMQLDGIPTLRNIMKMYKHALKKQAQQTESIWITPRGEQQLREMSLLDRIKKNLLGNK